MALFLLFLLFLPYASPLLFNLSSFDDQISRNCIDHQGDAFVNHVLQLTKNELGVNIVDSIGRAVYHEPLQLWDINTGEVTNFKTHFTFMINSFGKSVYGDGLTFFMSPYPSILPNDSTGGYLGLFSKTSPFNESENSLVAVEFDTYSNPWDPKGDHVGINVNSLKSVVSKVWKGSIKDGKVANAWVTYTASTKNLSVFLNYNNATAKSKGKSSISCIIDLKKILPDKVAIGFSGSTGNATEIHNILSWDFTSDLVVKENKSVNVSAIIGAIVATVIILLLLGGSLMFVLWKRSKKKQEKDEDFKYDATLDDEFEKGGGPKRIPFGELVAATKNFAKEFKLGEGGFGEVYKGVLSASKLKVAIKRVSAGSKQGRKEYMAEVKIISRLRHRNLVQLVGWCHGRGEFLLVYEYMPNGSLDTHLYSQKRFLDWHIRYKIALGLASSLLYLHEEWEQCVVHRDIKPSNVMLDSSFNAKLGDFGLARLVDHGVETQMTMLAGTMGYLAPECVTSGRASKESDVYSFGIVALEIACGRRPIDPREHLSKVKLVEWVWELYGKRMIIEAADPRLEMDFEEKEIVRLMVVGLWCAHPDYNARPSIRQALNALNLESGLPDLPPKMPVPMFYLPPMDINKLTFTSLSSGVSSSSNSSGGYRSGYTTNSSASSASTRSSSTACLLKTV